QDVAHEPGASRAFDGRFRKQPSKGGVVEPNQISQRRRHQRLTRSKLGFAPHLREFVPGTYSEAIIAAVNAITDGLPKLACDRRVMLDRQERNAPPRVEPVGLGERRGRTNIEARAAGPTMIGLDGVRRKLERGEDRAEE